MFEHIQIFCSPCPYGEPIAHACMVWRDGGQGEHIGLHPHGLHEP
jgi:hypothetical protein